jgi:hypothetical protein
MHAYLVHARGCIVHCTKTLTRVCTKSMYVCVCITFFVLVAIYVVQQNTKAVHSHKNLCMCMQYLIYVCECICCTYIYLHTCIPCSQITFFMLVATSVVQQNTKGMHSHKNLCLCMHYLIYVCECMCCAYIYLHTYIPCSQISSYAFTHLSSRLCL